MTTVAIDTYRLVNTLKEHGFTEEQARGVKRVVQDMDFDHFSTKRDLRELELSITIKIGTMMFIGFGFLAAIKFFG